MTHTHTFEQVGDRDVGVPVLPAVRFPEQVIGLVEQQHGLPKISAASKIALRFFFVSPM